MKEVAESGKPVLFVGTKKQAQAAIEDEAKRCGHVLCQSEMARRYADQL